MDDKFIVAIIGAITGVVGLLLHLWRFIQESPSINIYQPSGYNGQAITCFPEDPEDMIYNEMGEAVHKPDVTKYCFWLWIRITNTSEKPLTFLEFALSLPGLDPLVFDSTSYAPKFAEQVISFEKNCYRVYDSCTVEPLIQPVFSLDPFKAIEGYIHFGPVDLEKLRQSKGQLKIVTTRKSFIKTVNIDPIYASSI